MRLMSTYLKLREETCALTVPVGAVESWVLLLPVNRSQSFLHMHLCQLSYPAEPEIVTALTAVNVSWLVWGFSPYRDSLHLTFLNACLQTFPLQPGKTCWHLLVEYVYPWLKTMCNNFYLKCNNINIYTGQLEAPYQVEKDWDQSVAILALGRIKHKKQVCSAHHPLHHKLWNIPLKLLKLILAYSFSLQ